MDKPCILVAEDHEPLLNAIRSILETEGYAVLAAADGRQALEIMEQERPDLILADIMMPQMDGYALYDAVRARSEWASIPFVFLTAKAERKDILAGKSLGVEDYLTKPFDPEMLVVTVRARLERAQAMQQAAEAEFEQLKKQIVTVLSHELRTPLTYVRSYTDLALEDVPSLSPEILQHFLLGVKRGADRLVRLTEDLLILVQLDTGQMARDFQTLAQRHDNLHEIVMHTLQKYEPTANVHGVQIVYQPAASLPPVRLFEPFFADALGRLVENGIKFSHGRGKQVWVTTRAVDDGVEIAVSDEGIGIPPEEIPHIFKRFRQIGRERLEQQGIGMGLAIAHEMVRLHNGTITVRSEPGQGSTFTIHLPALKEP